ncbi:hypothetical protein Krac_7345 [Ktedonobacter racemifer DSM 44963]|uniref:Uncharacterized protein n=1 Tax=Ktedonobacter racemifer DSM 44963 TaxID=485913 RepID=D6TS03_KTERA|nr:hypothetical protein Krac_7345 [Ktedonobacter racemifer DSM 44963]
MCYAKALLQEEEEGIPFRYKGDALLNWKEGELL